MKVINFNELELTGANGEVISVSPIGHTSNVVMAYTLNGTPLTGSTFTLSSALFPVFKLLATTVYKTTSGGSVDITISATVGGAPSGNSVHHEVQTPGEAFDVAMYRFTIV